MGNLEWNMTQKLDPTLVPSNYKQLPKVRMLAAENSICPRRFIRDGPELLHKCSTCMSIPRPYLRGVLLIFAEYIWSYVVRTVLHADLLSRHASPLEVYVFVAVANRGEYVMSDEICRRFNEKQQLRRRSGRSVQLPDWFMTRHSSSRHVCTYTYVLRTTKYIWRK